VKGDKGLKTKSITFATHQPPPRYSLLPDSYDPSLWLFVAKFSSSLAVCVKASRILLGSDYLTDNAFVEALLYEKKNGCFSFLFYFLKERMFFFPQISVPIETNPSLGKTSLLSMVSSD